MKAAIRKEYGQPEVLRLAEVEKPQPDEEQVLIKIVAVSVNRSDWEGLVGSPLYARIGGLFRPGSPILGSDVAGRVEAVGANVRRFRVGDEVFGLLPGYGGGFAEYACAPESAFALKPADITFEEASTIPQAGVIALQGIRNQGQVQPGQRVLINGAGGGAGTFAVQLAKLAGAQVTGVDNAGKQEFLRSLGADHVIDYTQEDFTRSGKQYDLILDVIAHRSIFAFERALAPNGKAFMVGGSVATMFQMLLLGPWIRRAGKQIQLLVVPPSVEDMLAVTDLVLAGKVVPIIDRRYPLSEVAQALGYLGEGHARGKVITTMPDN